MVGARNCGTGQHRVVKGTNIVALFVMTVAGKGSTTTCVFIEVTDV
jgi:hypothetical protein